MIGEDLVIRGSNSEILARLGTTAHFCKAVVLAWARRPVSAAVGVGKVSDDQRQPALITSTTGA